ncbi:MAG: VTC domain-containing protein [Planctomycetota bacterium]|jgi:SPX domain protein involved in polyphosphate accumulation
MSEYIRTFNRYELKYLLHHRVARDFVEAIRPHVHTDKNAEGDGFYKVASLYYDSPPLACYWEKMDGEKFRRKVRVRTYGPCPEDAFIEIKQRYNLSVQKRRCRYPIDEAQALMAGIIGGSFEAGKDPVLDEVFLLSRRNDFEPKVVISYNRMAFFDLYKNDLRITLDRNIRARNLSLDLASHRLRGRHAIPPTMILLEVKFNEAIPRWLCTVLNSLDAQVQRISKYCYGVDALGMVLRTAAL